jgi:hypothetical protein
VALRRSDDNVARNGAPPAGVSVTSRSWPSVARTLTELVGLTGVAPGAGW